MAPELSLGVFASTNSSLAMTADAAAADVIWAKSFLTAGVDTGFSVIAGGLFRRTGETGLDDVDVLCFCFCFLERGVGLRLSSLVGWWEKSWVRGCSLFFFCGGLGKADWE